jgi:hypothetical protein
MSESKMIGDLDAKRRQVKFLREKKKNEWPWQEFTRHEDGSESGIEGYLYTPHGADFQIRGTVRWWRSAAAVEAAKNYTLKPRGE